MRNVCSCSMGSHIPLLVAPSIAFDIARHCGLPSLLLHILKLWPFQNFFMSPMQVESRRRKIIDPMHVVKKVVDSALLDLG